LTEFPPVVRLGETPLGEATLSKQQRADDDIETPRQKFDLMVTHRHPKTGQIIKHDPYILRVCGEIGSSEKSQYWERPAGSGNLYDAQMNPVGRWEYEDKVIKGKAVKVGKLVEGAAHIAWAPPETQDQKISRENAALKAEIAALKAEQAKAAAPAKTEKKQDKGA
jgi:hypothetical protein